MGFSNRKPPNGTSSLKKNYDHVKKPVQETHTGAEFYEQTEHTTNFIKHDVKPRYFHPKKEYVPSDAKFDGTTNQHADYKPWPVSVPERHQAPKYIPNDVKFAGVSTSTSDYPPKPLPVHYVHPVRKYVKSEEKGEFGTTQGSDYQQWKVEVPKRWKPDTQHEKGQYSVLNIGHHEKNGNAGGAEFYDQTENAKNFVKHDVKPRYFHPKREYVPSTEKFDGTTNQHSDFKPWPVAVPERHQAPKYVPTTTKFAGVSTTYSDFTPKPLAAPYVHPVRKYVKSEEKGEFGTTQASDFQQWKVEVPKRWKPSLTTTKGQYSVINIGHHH